MPAERRAAGADLRGGAGWIAFGLAILVGAWRMDRFESMGATLYTAPGLVPGIFGLLLIVLGAVLAWRGWRELHARRVALAHSVTPIEPLLNRRIVIMLALTLGYAAVLVGRVPFTAATALFVAVFTFAFAVDGPAWRRAGVALLSGLLTTVAIVLVFERIFLVRLP
jgi:hypothetical protein